MDYKAIARTLAQAEARRAPVGPLTALYPDMTAEDAYRVQLENAARRIAAGETRIGMKAGLTSPAMQKAMGVDAPDFGHLFDCMLLAEGQPCRTGGLIQLKAEGELSFCLGSALKGPGVTVADVLRATRYVVPSIEIVDSRIRDWDIRLQDTIADNGSAARLMLGGRMTPPEAVDMRLTGMTLEKNGVLVGSGATAEVWGNPAAVVAWLANTLAAFGMELPAGSIVMTGAVTAAVPVQAGDVVTASFTGMGSVSVRFEEGE